MHLEKNIKNKNQLTSSDLREKKTFSLKNWIEIYRLRTRNKLVSNPMNVTTILGFLPFALAFCQFVTDKTKLSSNAEPFFGKNLPIFVNFKPKLTSETFHYIVSANSQTLLKSKNTNFLLGQPQFLTQVKKLKTNEHSLFFKNSGKQVSGLCLDYYMLPSGNFFSQVQKSMQNLDELPSYVQGLRKSSQIETDSLNSSSQTVLEDKENGKKIIEQVSSKKTINSSLISEKSITNVSRIFESEPSIPESKKVKRTFTFLKNQIGAKKRSFLVNENDIGKNPSKMTKKLSLLKKSDIDKNLLSQPVSIKNPFYKTRVDYYKTLQLLDTELENLFLEQKITLSLENDESMGNLGLETELSPSLGEESVLSIFSKQNIKLDDDEISELILRNLQNQKICDDVSGFRLMSGYNYPDTATQTLQWYYKQNSFFGNSISSGFKPDISLNLSSSNKYSLKIKKVPSFLVETKIVNLKDRDENEVLYSGSALLLDSQKALDWKIYQPEGTPSLRSWFHQYLSVLNPLSPTRKNFIGMVGKNIDFSEFQDTALFHDVFVPREKNWGFRLPYLQNSLSPNQSSWHLSVPDSKKFLDKTKFTRGISLTLSKEDDPIEKKEFLPIIETKHPFFKTSSRKKQNFQGYSSNFDLGVTANPDYKFSLELAQDSNTRPELNSGRYLQISSVFGKQNRSGGLKIDNWEPLTTNSWLVISQLSFFVFSLQVFNIFVSTYGKEIVGYLLNLIATLGILDENLKEQIEYWMGERDKGFRVVLESQKNFSDIVGVEKFLPEIYEVIWFLRNGGREFQLSQTLPRGVLLTGPPGTGKTLLVQALAGEAQVPVVVLSGSSLIGPGESGSTKLEMAFQEAREVAPCIVFIDEIDTLAQKRSGIVHSPMGQDDLVESLVSFENSPAESIETFETSLKNKQDEPISKETGQPNLEQLSLLTRLLIELDGIKGRDGLLVIGATNRPEVLDPAALRPGRFDKIIKVGLPTKQKRVEILQFYGNRLGYEPDIPWNYLGERTVGFSAADLAALMNESAIKAILTKSNHSIKTIEHGIDRLTTSESEKYTLVKTKLHNSAIFSIPSKFSILRLAYYQAGKILVSYFLENHPKSVFASLWPRRPSIRSLQIATNLQNLVFDFAQLCELNDRVIGCYAGKATEILFLEKFSVRRYVHMSTLGIEDIFFAQKLIYSILEKSFLYSKKSQIQKLITLSPNINARELREVPEKIDIYHELLETIEIPPMKKTLELETSSLKSNEESELENLNAQSFYSVPWWQQETSYALEFVEKNFTNWSRLYLLSPERSERNTEWVPPDEFYHSSSGLKNIKTAFKNVQKLRNQKNELNQTSPESESNKYPPQQVNFSWNDVTHLTRDYPAQSLALQSFNKALVILNQNRELLDRLVVELLYHEVLRQPEIELLIKDFTKTKSSQTEIDFFGSLENSKSVKIIESSWGPRSRKPMPRWIDFTKI